MLVFTNFTSLVLISTMIALLVILFINLFCKIFVYDYSVIRIAALGIDPFNVSNGS